MIRRLLAGVTLAVAAACGGGGAGTTVTAPPIEPRDTVTSYAGFDIGVYPGDAAMQAWKYPSSPFRWVGYYLPSSCHRDTSFVGKRVTLTNQGWGLAVLYVGQQDWANLSIAPAAALNMSAEQQAVCSASLLSASQGTAEAADAVARLKAEGFPAGTTVFLDVEHVTTMTQSLMDYVRAWTSGVLSDGQYKPGLYAHKANAPAFYDQAIIDLHGTRYTPPFWIASWSNFAITNKPTDVGLSFAQLWQGQGNASQTYNGVKLSVDLNVASKASPSSP